MPLRKTRNLSRAPNKTRASTVITRCPKLRPGRLRRASQYAIVMDQRGEFKNESEITPGPLRRQCGRSVPRNRGPISRAGGGERPGAWNDRWSRRIDAHGEDPRRPERDADAEVRLEDGRRRQGVAGGHQAWGFRRDRE